MVPASQAPLVAEVVVTSKMSVLKFPVVSWGLQWISLFLQQHAIYNIEMVAGGH